MTTFYACATPEGGGPGHIVIQAKSFKEAKDLMIAKGGEIGKYWTGAIYKDMGQIPEESRYKKIHEFAALSQQEKKEESKKETGSKPRGRPRKIEDVKQDQQETPRFDDLADKMAKESAHRNYLITQEFEDLLQDARRYRFLRILENWGEENQDDKFSWDNLSEAATGERFDEIVDYRIGLFVENGGQLI